MNREDYLKKLKESVEKGVVDEDLTSHHYAILDKAKEKAHNVKLDLGEDVKFDKERVAQIREEGKPSERDRIRLTENGNIEHVEQTAMKSIESDLLSDEEIKLKKYVSQINEILGEEKVTIKNGDIFVADKNEITPEQITKDRVIREITLLEQENQRCYGIISKNNDLLTYLKIELSTL